jgi:RNA polymerase sigma factor (sigma-70 family)
MGNDTFGGPQADDHFDEHFDPLDPTIRSLIYHEARRLLGQAGITRSEIDDVAQDLTINLILGMLLFDPELSSLPTFAHVVLERAAAKALRYRQAAKRDVRRTTSLDALLERWTGGSRPTRDLKETIGPDTTISQQLKMDLATVISKLSPALRDLAERLMTNSIGEIARATGIPRTTLSSRKQRILERFKQAGLDDYLK